jgi:hypothetical protein
LKPAEPTTEFHHLKPDMLALIANKLAHGPRAEAVRDVVRLSVVNRALREAVTTDSHARRRLRDDAPLFGNARQLIKELLSGDPNPQPEEARLCLPVLGLLDRQQQATLVRALTDPASYSCDHCRSIHRAFEELVPRLAELDPPLREDLVERAIGYPEDKIAASAIGELAGGLAHLDTPLIDRLVHRATTLRRRDWRANAIVHLSVGCGQLNPDQRQRLWQATQDLQGQHPSVMQGLGAQLKHLLPNQRTHLFEQALHLRSLNQRAIVLTGVAASIDVLDKQQRTILFTQALSFPAGSWQRANIVCALAAGVKHMTDDERIQVVNAVRGLGLDRDRGTAILGARLAHLEPEQQHQLLDDAAGWPDAEKATAVAGFSTIFVSPAIRPVMAVAGFAAEVQGMEPACRRKVGNLVLGMTDDDAMARAIGALGPQLRHLDGDQRDAVVKQALRLLSSETVCGASSSDRPLRALTAGLGAGMEALRGQQRDALVAAVAAMHRHSSPGALDFRHLPAIATAIAGLASGQQHLSEAGFAALVQAASRVENDLPMARYQLASSQHREARATVLFGLVQA